MSHRGIYGHINLCDGTAGTRSCLLIGDGVPRIHHSDGMPVYLVIEDDRGFPVLMKNGSIKNLLAYPSHWPGPREYNHEHWLYGSHERLTWHALIPCFDGAAE